MAGEWDDLACQYAPAVWQQWLQPQIIAHLKQQQQQQTAELLLLDFGCGTGMLIEQIFEHKDALLEHCSSITILAVDASTAMLAVLNEKIRSCGWNDETSDIKVISHHWKLGSDSADQFMAQYTHSVHILLASLVLSYIPPAETPTMMQALQRLLVPRAVLLQTDWPPATGATPPADHPMTLERARELYASGGFVPITVDIRPLRMAPGNAPDILFGVAILPE